MYWPGLTEWIIIGIIALLIFGNRLPSVARSFGKSIVEFKKGMQGINEELKDTDKIEHKEDSSPK